jgi:hypothetical protein
LPLLFGKSYLIKMAKASKIQILEPVSMESKRYLLFGVKMQEPMTETIFSLTNLPWDGSFCNSNPIGGGLEESS